LALIDEHDDAVAGRGDAIDLALQIAE